MQIQNHFFMQVFHSSLSFAFTVPPSIDGAGITQHRVSWRWTHSPTSLARERTACHENGARQSSRAVSDRGIASRQMNW